MENLWRQNTQSPAANWGVALCKLAVGAGIQYFLRARNYDRIIKVVSWALVGIEALDAVAMVRKEKTLSVRLSCLPILRGIAIYNMFFLKKVSAKYVKKVGQLHVNQKLFPEKIEITKWAILGGATQRAPCLRLR